MDPGRDNRIYFSPKRHTFGETLLFKNTQNFQTVIIDSSITDKVKQSPLYVKC